MSKIPNPEASARVEREPKDQEIDKGLEQLYDYLRSSPYGLGRSTAQYLEMALKNARTGLRQNIRQELKEAQIDPQGLKEKVNQAISRSSYEGHFSWMVKDEDELFGFVDSQVLKEAKKLHNGDSEKLTEEEIQQLEEEYSQRKEVSGLENEVPKPNSALELELIKKVLKEGAMLGQLIRNEKLNPKKYGALYNEALVDLLNQFLTVLMGNDELYDLVQDQTQKQRTKAKITKISQETVAPVIALSLIILNKEDKESS